MDFTTFTHFLQAKYETNLENANTSRLTVDPPKTVSEELLQRKSKHLHVQHAHTHNTM